MSNNSNSVWDALVADVTRCIEKVEFRGVYERTDPSIQSIVVIPQDVPMAEYIAGLLEGSPRPVSIKAKVDSGEVQVWPSFLKLKEDLRQGSPDWAEAKKLQLHILGKLDQMVRVYYCPPGHFVQFTGEVCASTNLLTDSWLAQL